MIKANHQVNLLVDELSRKKNNAFTKLSQALNIDESTDLFDEKLNLYADALKLIDDALRYFTQNESILTQSDYAIMISNQLNDIKTKTLIRVNDLYDLKYKTLPAKNYPTKFNTISTSNVKFRKKIKKCDISEPSNFRLVQHVGYNNKSNQFEINLSPEDDQSNRIKRLLLELNIPIKMNKKTSEFIDNYVKNNGGYERFSEEISKKQQIPVEQTKPLTFYNKCHTLIKKSQIEVTTNIQKEEPIDLIPIMISTVPQLPPPPPPPLPPPSLPPSIPSRPHNPPLIKSNYSDVKSDIIEHDIEEKQLEGVPLVVNHISPFPIPPPPPPPLNMSKLLNISNTSINSSSLSTNTSNNTNERQNLMESIRCFQGFNKSASLPRQNSNSSSSTNCLNRSSDISSPQPDSSNSSIIDQLRSELLRRAQFLNDSSDNDNDQSDEIDEW